ncbi:hypothetical protein BLNAU_14582 [Blattamonas nauphoetae]|uniref:Uncharacterized protein n=1 Tax=Blattamonas nauphoetae TaxID=2049346 RepID=A0ABQ9XFK1_9EUKA|nr:hypothetical protein BLNAU_14582 [Blattamonas nauphoetae]
MPSSQKPFSMDCLPFLNWSDDVDETVEEKAVVFGSLVATVKIQPSLDVSLEAKAVNFLESIHLANRESATAVLSNFASLSDNSLADFVQCICELISSASQAITTAAMKMLESLINRCSTQGRLALVKADLVPQLINNLNPLSLSFAKAADIHIHLLASLTHSLLLATPNGLAQLTIEDADGQQAVHETVLKQVLVPSEQYICHFCVNRFSIIDGVQSMCFMELLAQLLQICPYYQPAMDFVLDLSVFLTIPSCLAIFEDDFSIWSFLIIYIPSQGDWNRKRAELRQISKKLDRMLRTEGIEDVIQEKLQNDQEDEGESIVTESIGWNNLLGMNLPKLCLCVIFVGSGITSSFAGTIGIVSLSLAPSSPPIHSPSPLSTCPPFPLCLPVFLPFSLSIHCRLTLARVSERLHRFFVVLFS